MNVVMKRLQDRVAVITGAASGLGRASAERFAQEGARVVVADINVEAGQAFAQTLPDALFVPVDVADPAAVAALIDRTVEHYGRIDILFNNAGISGSEGPTADCSVENWRRVMAVNLDGVFYGMKFGIAAMLRQQSGGVVLNTASIAGLAAFARMPPYAASKAAVIHLTKSAAIEYAAQGIRVNAICPTLVYTPMVAQFFQNSPDPEATAQAFTNINPMPGAPTPEEIAAAAAFLASDDARFITGIALPVDGGYTAR